MDAYSARWVDMFEALENCFQVVHFILGDIERTSKKPRMENGGQIGLCLKISGTPYMAVCCDSRRPVDRT